MWQALPSDIVDLVFDPDRDLSDQERSVARCVCLQWRNIPHRTGRHLRTLTRFKAINSDFQSELLEYGLAEYISQIKHRRPFNARGRLLCVDVCDHLFLFLMIEATLYTRFRLDFPSLLEKIRPTDDFVTKFDMLVTWFETGKTCEILSEGLISFYEAVLLKILSEIVSSCWTKEDSTERLFPAFISIIVVVLVAAEIWLTSKVALCSIRRTTRSRFGKSLVKVIGNGFLFISAFVVIILMRMF